LDQIWSGGTGGILMTEKGDERVYGSVLRVALAIFLCCLGSSWADLNRAASALEAQRFQPALSLSEARFDFGEALEGTVVEHDFVVRNTGDEVLEIRKVSRD
jgi:hypothetical protein